MIREYDFNLAMNSKKEVNFLIYSPLWVENFDVAREQSDSSNFVQLMPSRLRGCTWKCLHIQICFFNDEIVCRIWSSVCIQEIKNLNLADFSGTAGYRMGCTLTPCLNNAADKRVAFNELPVIAGTTAIPELVPVSIPAALACSRKNFPRACKVSTRSGNSFIRRSAAKEAAATLGGIPTL